MKGYRLITGVFTYQVDKKLTCWLVFDTNLDVSGKRKYQWRKYLHSGPADKSIVYFLD